MPAIYLFQRRTLYGGDDLHLLALVTATVRVCQLLCFGVLVYHIVHNVQYNMDMAAANANASSATSRSSSSVRSSASVGSSVSSSTTGVESTTTDSPFGVAWNPHDHPLEDYGQFDVQGEHSSSSSDNTVPFLPFEEENTFEPSLPPVKDDDDAAVAPLPDYYYERRRLLVEQDKTTTSKSSTTGNNNSNNNNNLGLFLLEYFWMDAAHNSLLNGGGDLVDKSASCSNSHLYPLLLMSFTAAGVVFGVGSIVMLWHIYQTSSMGCPTMSRHPRTEKMEQLLEWLFFPMNILHFLIFILGVSAMMMAYTYMPCDSYSIVTSSPSNFFTILWILSAILILISQAIEIFWNFAYVLTLFYQDPHALVWGPNNTTSQSTLTSYHSSSSLTNPMMADAAPRQQTQYPSDEDLEHYMNHELVEQMWADRCSSICRCLGMGTCYVFGGRELYGSGIMQYGDFARAMADYLETRGVLDVVPSDIIVGFLVLQQLQTQRRHSQRREVLVEHSKLSLYSNTTTSFSTLEPNSTRSVTPFGSSQQPQLHNHRANAKGSTPNGMQLQARSPPPTPAAATTDVLSSPDTLFQSPAQPYQQPSSSESLVPTSNRSNGATASSRSVLLQSMGTGTALLADTDQSTEVATGNLLGINSPHNNNVINGGDIMIDQSTPPPRPQSFSSLTAIKNKSNHGTNSGTSAMNENQESSSLHQQQEPNRFRGFQRVLSEHNHADVLALEEGARYSKYALAIYTWYLYLYVNPVTGIPKLCTKAWNTKNCSCCFSGGQHDNNSSNNNNGSGNGMASHNSSPPLHQSPSASNTNIGSPRLNGGSGGATIHYNRAQRFRWEGDNICQAHKNALLLTAGLENEADLVYVQLKSSFDHNPYCILLDHETQAVIVAVRGTFSLEDCVTDVLIEAECLEALGDEFGFGDIAKGQHVHGGVLACARNVYRDLKRHGSLEYLLETKYPHYQLRLVGHSLGAACSTMLGFMLRQTYPNLQCYNYSPPGCTLTWDMAIQCQPWCTSFVLDTEVVPRLSFESLENLRDEVLDLIGRIRVPKVEVARRVATKTLWCDGNKTSSSGTFADAATRQDMDIEQVCASVDAIDELLDDILLPVDEMPPADSASYREQLEQFQTVQSERRTARGTRRAIRLFPPGRILHLVKTDQEQSCRVKIAKCLTCCTTNAGSQYHPVWIGNGDLNEIVVSPTMGTDHFPNRMVDELHGIVQNYGLGEAPRR